MGLKTGRTAVMLENICRVNITTIFPSIGSEVMNMLNWWFKRFLVLYEGGLSLDRFVYNGANPPSLFRSNFAEEMPGSD